MSLLITALAALTLTGSPRREPDYGAMMGSAYDRLFNDMSLVGKSQFGISRVPNDPFNSHPPRGDAAIQVEIKRLRRAIFDGGYRFEEGVATNIPAMMHRIPSSGPGLGPWTRVAYWQAFSDKGDPLFGSWNRSGVEVPPELIKFTNMSFDRAKTRPSRFSERGYQIYAIPIRFEHEECLGCHKAAKLGDTAAVYIDALKGPAQKPQ